jgi:hypothetical protein
MGMERREGGTVEAAKTTMQQGVDSVDGGG